MEQFKKMLLIRKYIFLALGIVASVYILFVHFFATPEMQQHSLLSVQSSRVLVALAILQVAWCTRTLRSEVVLRKAYNKAHDERLIAIRAKAGMPMLLITSILMFVVGIGFGSTNPTVFYTLILAAVGQLFIGACVKIYYLRRL